MITAGKVTRFSPDKRLTKGIVFRTTSGRHFAVEFNTAAAHSDTQRTKLVFERAPGCRL
jgi:hypothetical protein